ncbi:MAG: hypothetical protein ABMB14_37555, partial [Myxococcota bacterium]
HGPLVVTLTNARSGHLVPTGDPERHLRVEARAVDASGAVLGRDLRRIGQRWDWGDDATGRPAKRLVDDRLRPGESVAWRPVLDLTGADRVVVEVVSVRLAPDTARWLSGVALPPDPGGLDLALDAVVAEVGPSLAAVDRVYPLATVVFRETAPLDGRPPEIVPLDALLAESAAAASLPLDDKAARYAVP